MDDLLASEAAAPGPVRFSRSPLYAQLTALLAGGCLLGCAASALLALEMRSLFDAGSPTPVTVRAADLRGWGDGDGVHVTVTEFGFGRSYVATQRSNRSSWDGIWIPLLPPEGRRGLRVVAHTSRIKNKEELDAFIRRNSLTGVLTADRSGMPVKKFEESYPGVDFSQTLVLSVDRRFPRPAQIRSLATAAAALLAAGAVGLALWLVRWRKGAAPRLSAAPPGEKVGLGLFGLLLAAGAGFFLAGAVL